MPLVVKDRVKETTTTAGTGTITLAGAVSGFQSFSVIGNGNTTYYAIVGGTQWEVGIGTYTASGTTLSRDTVLESSTGGTKVDFAAGTKDVFVTYPAEESVDLDTAQTLTNKTFDGGTIVTANSSADALRITQTGAGNALVIEDSANPDSTPVVVDASGNVSIGKTTATSLLDIYSATSAVVNIAGDSTSQFIISRYSSDTTPVNIAQRKYRGSFASPAAVASGDTVGTNAFAAYDGAAVRTIANIQGFVDTYTGSDDVSGYLVFSTRPDGAGASIAQRMRLTSAGDLGLGVTAPAAKLEAYGTIQARPAATQDAVAIAGRAGGTSSYVVTLTPATLSANRTLTLPDPGSNETLGYLNIPQNSQSAAYTLQLTDSGKHIFHPSADTTARTFTIPPNSGAGSVAFPIGTAVTFINQNGAGVVTIAITTDTMRLAGAGTTGSRTLAANGVATAIKITSTEWIISGTGLT